MCIDKSWDEKGRGRSWDEKGRGREELQYLTPVCLQLSAYTTDSYATSQVFARGEVFMRNAVLFLSL